jgi:hypothetical protein
MSEHDPIDDAAWRKASASGGNGCVELAPLPNGGVAIRDSKDSTGPILRFTRKEWESFLDGLVNKGEFDHLMESVRFVAVPDGWSSDRHSRN